MRTLVSLDIETTGVDPERDRILEIGIVRFRGEQILEEWSSLVDPHMPIPPRITELTGITDAMVQREGIPLWKALGEAQRMIGDAPIIGHNISFDLGFFRSLSAPPLFARNPAMDTFELASLLVPHAGRYSLGALALTLGIHLPESHRALADARTAHQLYLKLFERAMDLPPEVVREIGELARRGNWALAEFWRDIEAQQALGRFSTSIGAALRRKLTVGASGQTAFQRQAAHQARLRDEKLAPKATVTLLDVEQLAKLLGEDGPFAARFPGYEMRPQQMTMLRKVASTFNEEGMTLIEAGTGVGKSLAYLIPAMQWAIQNNRRVVISTNTINLQEQLAEKDVPTVVDILNQSGRAAVMKGKARYLCPTRFAEWRRNGPRTPDEVRLMARILLWLPNTLTGDADELFIPSPAERAIFQHLSAQNPMCNINTCSATECFFYQARRLAESAHVVIVNHALLMSDIMVENNALPEYDYLIVDEAHHLEAAATEALTYRIDRDEMQRMLGDLANRQRQQGGLLGELAGKANALLVEQRSALLYRCDLASQTVNAAQQQTKVFFDELAAFIADQPSDDSADYARRVRLTRALRNGPGWSRVELACEALLSEIKSLINYLRDILKIVNDYAEVGADFDAFIGRLAGGVRFLEESEAQLKAFVFGSADERICWVEVEDSRQLNRPPRLTLNAAPLHVGALLKTHLWEKKKAVVLTSATLRTATANGDGQPSFEYVKERLHAFDADTLALGSPFDYRSSTLLYLVTDIPEPNQPGYQQALDQGLIALFRASEGRGLALFTSYSGLRASARALGPALLRDGIQVFEQGSGLSRRAMIDNFRSADRAVMLGTRSFWEGVDIQGEKLSALAICKLPFDVPSDPIFAARSETFDNAFNEFSVPETVLRFRQGFGRLIRSKSDYGVVVIFDRRVLTKSYGAAFLNALPQTTIVRAPLAQLGATVRKWLASKQAQSLPVPQTDVA